MKIPNSLNLQGEVQGHNNKSASINYNVPKLNNSKMKNFNLNNNDNQNLLFGNSLSSQPSNNAEKTSRFNSIHNEESLNKPNSVIMSNNTLNNNFILNKQSQKQKLILTNQRKTLENNNNNSNNNNNNSNSNNNFNQSFERKRLGEFSASFNNQSKRLSQNLPVKPGTSEKISSGGSQIITKPKNKTLNIIGITNVKPSLSINKIIGNSNANNKQSDISNKLNDLIKNTINSNPTNNTIKASKSRFSNNNNNNKVLVKDNYPVISQSAILKSTSREMNINNETSKDNSSNTNSSTVIGIKKKFDVALTFSESSNNLISNNKESTLGSESNYSNTFYSKQKSIHKNAECSSYSNLYYPTPNSINFEESTGLKPQFKTLNDSDSKPNLKISGKQIFEKSDNKLGNIQAMRSIDKTAKTKTLMERISKLRNCFDELQFSLDEFKNSNVKAKKQLDLMLNSSN